MATTTSAPDPTIAATAPDVPAARTKPENSYARTYANFLKNTQGHSLTVVHEDNLYRQLRMHDPEMGSIWS